MKNTTKTKQNSERQINNPKVNYFNKVNNGYSAISFIQI